MKRRALLLMAIAMLLVLSACRPAMPTVAPRSDSYSYTVADLHPRVADLSPLQPFNESWSGWDSAGMGFLVRYPPDWQARWEGDYAIGLYPPTSNPDMPSPAIHIEWLNVPYQHGTPLVAEYAGYYELNLWGEPGQAYQDNRMALPGQASYVEHPYYGGILFFTTTIGPDVNLGLYLDEILASMQFFPPYSQPVATEAPVSYIEQPVFIYPEAGQTLTYDGNFLFKVYEVPQADGYVWTFTQNGEVLWQNLRDEGQLSSNYYAIMQNSAAWNRFQLGAVEVMVEAYVNGVPSAPTIITIYLR